MRLPAGTRLMLGFTSVRGKERTAAEWLSDLAALGYRRCVLAERTEEIGAGAGRAAWRTSASWT